VFEERGSAFVTLHQKSPRLKALTRAETFVSLTMFVVLLAFAWVTYERAFEEADAQALQAQLLNFQQAFIEGSQRAQLRPKDVELNMVVEALPLAAPYHWTLLDALGSDQRVELSVTPSSRLSLTPLRAVTFRVNDCGDVCLLALTNFSYYHLRPNLKASCPEDPVATVCQYLSNE
jgi:hypothetical protein